jgi:hypothetical protein
VEIGACMTFKSVAYFLVVFLVGSLTSSLNAWLQPITTVEITNATSVPIKYIDISFRGLAEQHAQIAQNLKPGETVAFKWITEGEASYRLNVHFENGTEVVGGAGYISRGDVIKDAIGAKSIMSRIQEMPFLPFYSEPYDTTFKEQSMSRFRHKNAYETEK